MILVAGAKFRLAACAIVASAFALADEASIPDCGDDASQPNCIAAVTLLQHQSWLVDASGDTIIANASIARLLAEDLCDASVKFGDRFIQLGKWRIGAVDNHHFSIAHESGKTAMIYTSDGHSHSGPRSDWTTWGRPVGKPQGIEFGASFIQFGLWRFGVFNDKHVSIAHKGGKTARIWTSDGVSHRGPRRDYTTWGRAIGRGENVRIGTNVIQLDRWRLGVVDSSHLSLSHEDGKTSQIFRSDGTTHPGRRSTFSTWGLPLSECESAEAPVAYTRLDGVRCDGTSIPANQDDASEGDAEGCKSSCMARHDCRGFVRHDSANGCSLLGGNQVTPEVSDGSTCYVKEGSVPIPAPPTAEPTTKPAHCDAATHFGDRFVQLGKWRLGAVDDDHLSLAHRNGLTARIFKSDGTSHRGPRRDFTTWGRPPGEAIGVSFGDRFIQLGKFRIGTVDNVHLSISHESGNTAQVYKSDGTSFSGPRTDFSTWHLPSGPASSSMFGTFAIQLGHWRFGAVDDSHFSFAHIFGKTAQIYTSDGRTHGGPRSDYTTWGRRLSQCESSAAGPVEYTRMDGAQCGGTSIQMWSTGVSSDYGGGDVDNVDACQAVCSAHDECLGFDLEESTKRCSLWKGGPLTQSFSSGYQCYQKEAPNLHFQLPGAYVPGTAPGAWSVEEIRIVRAKLARVMMNPVGAAVQAGIQMRNTGRHVAGADKVLRLGFHDCLLYKDGTGGCDGCLDWHGVGRHHGAQVVGTDGHNNGLWVVAETLQAVYERTDFPSGAPYLPVPLWASNKSRADLWALATLVAVDISIDLNNYVCGRPLGTVHGQYHPRLGESDCEVEKPRDFVFQTGRKDCSGHPWEGANSRPYMTCKKESHPSPNGNGKAQLDFFRTNFGFNSREVVTIMGAHTIGTFHAEVSGFKYNWKFSHNIFNNGYFRMLARKPDFQFGMGRGPDGKQVPWRGSDNSAPRGTFTGELWENGAMQFHLTRNVCPQCHNQHWWNRRMPDMKQFCCSSLTGGRLCRKGCERNLSPTGLHEMMLLSDHAMAVEWESDEKGRPVGCPNFDEFRGGHNHRRRRGLKPCPQQSLAYPEDSAPMGQVVEEYADDGQWFVENFYPTLEKMLTNGYGAGELQDAPVAGMSPTCSNWAHGAQACDLPYFRLQHSEGMCVHPRGSTSYPPPGTPLVLDADCEAATKLSFLEMPDASGGFKLQHSSGLCVRKQGQTPDSNPQQSSTGNTIKLRESSDGEEQLLTWHSTRLVSLSAAGSGNDTWELVHVADSQYYVMVPGAGVGEKKLLTPRADGLVVDLNWGVGVWQRWNIERVAEGVFTIVSVAMAARGDLKYLGADGSGVRLFSTVADKQKWIIPDFGKVGHGQGQAGSQFQLKPRTWDSDVFSGDLVLGSCSGAAAVFETKHTSEEYFELSQGSECCSAVSANSGNKISLGSCDGSFRLRRVS
eukprot:TRINITY_DN4346_c0_g2_i1.p1 TRINITY_DN4346_c0_g2~~TRINITY_DN4346_c0_g2_i1.p1  ORF type:complete len:1442 (-),score=139.16 TRINITY_DN4346_c0_g2_i1:48-4373(-)